MIVAREIMDLLPVFVRRTASLATRKVPVSRSVGWKGKIGKIMRYVPLVGFQRFPRDSRYSMRLVFHRFRKENNLSFLSVDHTHTVYITTSACVQADACMIIENMKNIFFLLLLISMFNIIKAD